MTASPSPVPGPSLAGRMRRRDEILAAAAELFASDGYTNTSMREVAAASGILAGSLYHHFESKEAIAVELVEAYHADLVRVVREFGSVPVDPLPALRAYALEIAAVSFRHPAALQISRFDAPTTASSSLKTVVHAEPASVDRLGRTLISAASAASAIKDGTDLRILRYVLHRTTLNAGLVIKTFGIAANVFLDPAAVNVSEAPSRRRPGRRADPHHPGLGPVPRR